MQATIHAGRFHQSVPTGTSSSHSRYRSGRRRDVGGTAAVTVVIATTQLRVTDASAADCAADRVGNCAAAEQRRRRLRRHGVTANSRVAARNIRCHAYRRTIGLRQTDFVTDVHQKL